MNSSVMNNSAMNKLLIGLTSTTGLVGSALCWLLAMPVSAVEQRVSDPILETEEAQVCVISNHSRFNLVCERVSQLKNKSQAQPIDLATNPFESPDSIEFTEEESDSALALFGCDCSTCINALRSLRTMSVG
jgi:hypothetical protein